ncbi:Lrp/AsnC ligand binding domain-containing protein [Chloroflexota bacterium]
MSRKAYVLIDVKKGQATDIAIVLNGKPGILAADVILGPHDVIAVVEANDVDALARLVENEIAIEDGVERTNTCLIVSGHW